MSELFSQLGIDWKLLLSQGVNFLILLAVLTFVLWRPLLKVLEERRKKIELGLKIGEEAEKRLAQIDKQKAESLARAEEEALLIMKKSEIEAKENSQKMIADGAKKAAQLQSEAQEIIERKREEAHIKMMEEAKTLVRAAIIQTVRLRPEAVDEALVAQAIKEVSAL